MTTSDSKLQVIVLCAQWCGTCREYQEVYQDLIKHYPQVDWQWWDIEDRADDLGDLDIETFPSWLVARQGTVIYGGVMMPRLQDARRLMDHLVASEGQALPMSTDEANAQAYSALAQQITHRSA